MLHDKMRKMLASKKDLSPAHKKAKMDVAGALRDDMSDEMKNKLGSMKKVSVIAPDKQGLQEGLEKAKQLAAASPMDDQDQSQDPSQQGFDDGGQVDPSTDDGTDDGTETDSALASAQASMRKAFGYHNGAEVNERDPSTEEDEYEGEEGHDQMDEPDSEQHKYDDDEDNEFHGLDMDEVNDKLQKLMKMKSKMESN